MGFKDGLTSLFNSLANKRNATNGNYITSRRITFNELNDIYKIGLGNKIVRLKAGYALKPNNILFDNDEDKAYYLARLHSKVKEAFLWALVFGRGIIVINDGGDLSMPLEEIDKERVKFEVFSGDMVSVFDYITNLASQRYLKPVYYNVRGYNFHHTRVIDFTYVKPRQQDMPMYNLGGISEFELIYNQLINDGIVERASSTILEKNASLFYKIKGFKQALEAKQENNIVKFYSYLEDRRSIYGAGLLDSEDDVMNITQSLSNLDDVNNISLRRLAMVTGIPLAMLVGENVQGLNSTGQIEKTAFNEMIEILQSEYLLTPLNQFLRKLDLSPVIFKEQQNVSPSEKINYEKIAIENATALYDMGFNIAKYLKERGVEVSEQDDFENDFPI